MIDSVRRARSTRVLSTGTVVLAAMGMSLPVFAQEAEQPAAEGDIVVTAQKRSQSINDVPMSITALSGEQLAEQGINSAADLQRVVPGFSYTETTLGTPVYTLRGIGFYESSLSAPPAVSVYIDQVPIPYSAMTRHGAFDLARVEVLKGPQGTLFGSNNTGGAVNYIAARPTDEFAAGASLEFGSFSTLRADTFLSGPIAPNLRARLAVQTVQGDDWQKSATRPSDRLGKKNQLAGRFLLDWDAANSISVQLGLSGWRDRSDTTAGQHLALAVLNPVSCTPAAPQKCIKPEIVALARDPRDSRVADWTPGRDFSRDDWFYQASGRIDIDLGPDIQLTSLTAYSRYSQEFLQDGDGTPFDLRDNLSTGDIKSFSQEVRLASDSGGAFNWIIGANYQRDTVLDQTIVDLSSCSCANAIIPSPTLEINPYSNSRNRILAAFGNVDFKFGDFTLHAGARYTETKTRNVSGSRDTGNNSLATVFNILDGALTGIPGSIQPGGDVVVTIIPDPTAPRGIRALNTPVHNLLKEDNVSWRVGIDYEPTNDLLLYANISQGYKAGSFPINNASASVQYSPATQEKVLAYELGSKLTLLDRALQLNVAGFYYDYSDKQVRGRLIDPLGIFGALEALVNIPKSRVLGVEAQAVIRPSDGFTLNLGATYLDTKVSKSFLNFDPFANRIDFKGMRFPFSPKFSSTFDAQYEWGVSTDKKAFIGASGSYRSQVRTTFFRPEAVATVPSDPVNLPGARVPGDIFELPGYALFDVRLGLADADDKWRVSIWARNLLDKFYRTASIRATDNIYGYAGMPRTIGVTASYKF